MQKVSYLVTESFTMAMKGYRVLMRIGVNARVDRLSPGMSRNGCGYSIVVYNDPRRMVEILKRNNIRVKKIIEM